MKKFDVVFQPRAGGRVILRTTATTATAADAQASIERQFPGCNVMTVEEILPFRAPATVQMSLLPPPGEMPLWGTLGT